MTTVVLDHAGRADIGVVADVDRADDEFVAHDARIGELDLAADAGAVADRDEIDRADIELADDGVLADLGAERAQVERA